MKTSEIKISDIKTLADAVIEANEYFHGQIWWRGQGNSDWELQPSVFRIKDHGDGYENNIIGRFRQRAPARHHDTPSPNDYFGWLFLMQHYRLPTRLLDWSESPLYAAYFAVEDTQQEKKDGSLYALNPYALNESQVGKRGVWVPDNEQGYDLIKNAFGIEKDDVDFVLGIAPPEIDIRIMMQLSSFTIHGSGKSINSLSSNERYLIKYIIPIDAKNKLLEQLKLLGVRESNLFPDLEHLAKEIKPLVFKDKIEEKSEESIPDTKRWISDDSPISGFTSST